MKGQLGQRVSSELYRFLLVSSKHRRLVPCMLYAYPCTDQSCSLDACAPVLIIRCTLLLANQFGEGRVCFILSLCSRGKRPCSFSYFLVASSLACHAPHRVRLSLSIKSGNWNCRGWPGAVSLLLAVLQPHTAPSSAQHVSGLKWSHMQCCFASACMLRLQATRCARPCVACLGHVAACLCGSV